MRALDGGCSLPICGWFLSWSLYVVSRICLPFKTMRGVLRCLRYSGSPTHAYLPSSPLCATTYTYTSLPSYRSGVPALRDLLPPFYHGSTTCSTPLPPPPPPHTYLASCPLPPPSLPRARYTHTSVRPTRLRAAYGSLLHTFCHLAAFTTRLVGYAAVRARLRTPPPYHHLYRHYHIASGSLRFVPVTHAVLRARTHRGLLFLPRY